MLVVVGLAEVWLPELNSGAVVEVEDDGVALDPLVVVLVVVVVGLAENMVNVPDPELATYMLPLMES